ncbi:MAG: NifU family protein [Clostridia bacterium]|nr:NifU family protein [Clostridia bacterium]
MNARFTMKKYIEQTIKPKLQGDGGEIDFVSFDEGILTVLLQGECSKCLIVERCIAWIEDEILRDMGEKVKIVAKKKKPFFWDKG